MMAPVVKEVAGPSAQTLDRGLKLVHLLAAEPDGLTVTELAARLDVHRAIVYRLLGTLAQHRFVTRGSDGRHRLWTGLVEVARGVIPNWRAVAVPELQALADDLAATATLHVASEDAVVALLVVEPRSTPIYVAYQPGLRHPIAESASGTAILAGRPAVAGEPTVVTEARRQGHATSRGELSPGAIVAAAPIVVEGWADASVGAVSFGEFDASAVSRVIQAARTIASSFPGSGRRVAGDTQTSRA